MRRTITTLTTCLLALAALLALAPAASAEFGFKELDLTFEEEDGSAAVRAGSHPYAVTTDLFVNTKPDPLQGIVPDEQVKDLRIDMPPGLVGNPTAVPPCSSQDFATIVGKASSCPDSAALGVAEVEIALAFEPIQVLKTPVYNLEPPPGVAAQIGFVALGVPVTIDLTVNPNPPYNVIANLTNTPQAVRFFGSRVSIWGNPASPVHDKNRGVCAALGIKACSVSLPEKPFLTMPRSCTGPLPSLFRTNSWQNPGTFLSYPLQTEFGMSGCTNLLFLPKISAAPTTASAGSSSGLSFNLNVDDEGLTSPTGTAQSDIKKAVVTLPEGMTLNPSAAGGLEACSEGQFKAEAVDSEPGEGCPQASKVGEVEVETPLLEGKLLKGEVFVATQDQNPFGSMIALYMTIREPGLGVLVKLPGRVTPDPRTGQLVTTFGEAPYEIPQFPFSEFRFRFREGARAPLITPSLCGTYETKARFYPWANPASPYEAKASFQIASGPGGGPCPPPGLRPFNPDFEAGALNNSAGAFSPFFMRLTRQDGEQDMTKFSSILPPGQLGSLAGVAKCPDAAVEAAKSKTGRQELASPSCPAGSRIGGTEAGAGVGSSLTYVPGSLYLAGPYKGAPLSVVSITPAIAGPFDAGAVVVRLGLDLNPKTAQVEVDGSASDPIPHILQGIVLNVRDLRVHVDRPKFTLNPTSCEPMSVQATLFGSYLDVFNPADDAPVQLSERYQAANCANLAFKPRLSMALKGGTKRGGHPSFVAVYRPRAGDANLEGLQVRLPRSAFLDQGHIRTICTRVQFAADACPPAAQYGYIEAWTPLLEEPLKGPVWLRSSDHDLPDLVFDLRGLVDVEVATRIDSKGGGIRATVANAPDAPLSKVVLRMQGAKKGLIVNSRNLCAAPARADVRMRGQNGRSHRARPVLKARCGKAMRKGRGKNARG